MGEDEAIHVPVDIEEMIAALPIERTIRVGGLRAAGAGVCEMIGQPVRRRVLRPHRCLIIQRPRRLVGLRQELAVHSVQHQLAVFHLGAARDRGALEASRTILRVLVVEGPPRPRLDFRCDVGLQRGDLLRRKCLVINAGVVNRPAEMPGILLPAVTPADENPAATAERLWRDDRVLRIPDAVAIGRDLRALVNHGDLDKGVRTRRFRRERVLVSFRAREKVTPRHPFAGGQLAENDAVETIAPTLKREHAAAALREVCGRYPGNQRFIPERALLGSVGEGRHRPNQQGGDEFG